MFYICLFHNIYWTYKLGKNTKQEKLHTLCLHFFTFIFIIALFINVYTNKIMEDKKELERIPEEVSGLDVVNGITLQYMANKCHYEKYLKKNNPKPVYDAIYYKDRIIEFTKDLSEYIGQEREECETKKEVQNAFDNYLKQCIIYFQFLDRINTIQEKPVNVEYFKPMEEKQKTVTLDTFVKSKLKNTNFQKVSD